MLIIKACINQFLLYENFKKLTLFSYNGIKPYYNGLKLRHIFIYFLFKLISRNEKLDELNENSSSHISKHPLITTKSNSLVSSTYTPTTNIPNKKKTLVVNTQLDKTPIVNGSSLPNSLPYITSFDSTVSPISLTEQNIRKAKTDNLRVTMLSNRSTSLASDSPLSDSNVHTSPPSAATVLMDALNSSHLETQTDKNYFTSLGPTTKPSQMKPTQTSITGTTTTTTTTTTVLPNQNNYHTQNNHKKSNDKLFNIGFESLKLNNPVPFSALKNVKEHQHSMAHSSNNSYAGSLSGNHGIASNQSSHNTNILIAQRSISFKNNSSMESLAVTANHPNYHGSSNDLTSPNNNNKDNSNNFFVTNNGGVSSDPNFNNNSNPNAFIIADQQPVTEMPVNYRGPNRSSISNENNALCQLSARSESNCSRKEKKTSVGYRLGKRKLLFEKRKLISYFRSA